MTALPWAEPDENSLIDHGLYVLVINDRIIPGVYVYHADKKKFFWNYQDVVLRQVELALRFDALVATLPVTHQARVIARTAQITEFLDMVAA